MIARRLAVVAVLAIAVTAAAAPAPGLYTFHGGVVADTCDTFGAELVLRVDVTDVAGDAVHGRIGRLVEPGAGVLLRRGRWSLRVDAADPDTGCGVIAFVVARGRRARVIVSVLCGAFMPWCNMQARGTLTPGWTDPPKAVQYPFGTVLPHYPTTPATPAPTR